MAGFNLANYEPVEDRLARFWGDHPAGRVTTELVPAPEGQWIVRSEVWRDGQAERPDATGYAHEHVTDRGVNSTSALENCETSSIGRALANLGYAPKGARPSREEMTKAAKPDLRAQVIAASAPPKFATRDEFELAFESATGKTFADADDTTLSAFLVQVAA